jgi:hypothetical protein
MPNLGWRNVFPVPDHYDTARSSGCSYRPYYLRKNAPGGGPRGYELEISADPRPYVAFICR